MISKRFGGLLAVLVAIPVLGACQTIETTEATTELPPIERPEASVGTVWTWQTPDGPFTETLVGEANGVRRFENSDGCAWEERADDPLAPTLRWQNCPVGDRRSTGTQTVSDESGSMWPLTASSQASWSFTGSDRDADWESTRTCSVAGAVDLTVPAGTFTAQEVVCRDTWNTRTFFVAPEVGLVAYTKVHRSRGLEADRQLISVTRSTT